ncbi:MAG TPA: PhnD/SsuA/transferrin family substrate-binding protein, partial [Terriglobales bacterium]|nr:PhnD/SsuA/transferrin family substrate-binding protein [Terriglobales bacterium]
MPLALRRPTVFSLVACTLLAVSCGGTGSTATSSSSCPNGGTVRFGVEPFDDAAQMQPVYTQLATLIGKQLGCTVQLNITNNYTAEVEAMRAGKLEV